MKPRLAETLKRFGMAGAIQQPAKRGLMIWALLIGAVSAVVLPAALAAQERPAGISLVLDYRAGKRTGLMVLPVSGPYGDSVTTIMTRDLGYSDRFSMIPSSAAAAPAGALNYALYSKLGADGVVQGTLLPSGWLRILLHDVNKKAVVNQKDFALPASPGSAPWRMALHGVSDGIEEWITGQRGIAQTRIAFTRDGRVWTVDSDGANVTPVTPDGMSPQWWPSGRGLVYAVLDGPRSPIMAVDLATGSTRVVTSAPKSEDLTPVVSPDGRTVVFARVSENGTDLHAVPISGGTPRRITVGKGRASVQPSFSPDGQRIVFMSDRAGGSDVYISDVDGTNAEVLNASTYGDRSSRTGPDWSPDGRLVAYQSLNGNAKKIMTINLRDQTVREVASEGRNDDPSWAPDSRHLVFTSDRSGTRQLWIVDTESGKSRQLTRGSAARLSAWSPRLFTP